MDLVSVVLFLVMYYIRPQEWSSIFGKIHFVQIVMIMALGGLFTRERGLKFKDVLKTPHDWMMLFFFMWMILTSVTPWQVFQDNYPLAIFYIVIVQTLTDVRRLKIFVGWWTFLIVAIAALAIASEFGIDPLGGHDITVNKMKGRLVLNLSIFANPNALGHNVAPCIPMLYFFLIWKRPIFMKQLGSLMFIIPLWCIYLTLSKGTFLTTGGVIVATMAFGRPKTVQILIAVLAIMFGGTAFYALPRMHELDKSKVDPAIQGRVIAFTTAYNVLETQWAGCGRGRWLETFFHVHHYNKACHSSYVQTGAELGIPGFFLFLGCLYCNLRTLMMATTHDPDEERIRRTLFVLVLSYMVSSWMVDLGYRPTFFMFSAAVAAFHRHLYKLNLPESDELPSAAGSLVPAWRMRLMPQPALTQALVGAGGPNATVFTMAKYTPPQPALPGAATAEAIQEGEESEEEEPQEFWNRIGIIDIILIGFMTWGAIHFWAFMIKHM